ncbi:MAG: hypothetical protein JXA37_03935 [Chloroflexia bacterium]|nr:hypothetical protein [Chloroflexia bacterium]
MAPQVAYDGQGQALAVWERLRSLQDVSATLNITYTNELEIAYALWDGSSWTAPISLTNNTVLDHAPQLAQGQDGSLMLLWRQNGAGELESSASAPDTLYTVIWDGSTWSTPVSLDISSSLRCSLAYHDRRPPRSLSQSTTWATWPCLGPR